MILSGSATATLIAMRRDVKNFKSITNKKRAKASGMILCLTHDDLGGEGVEGTRGRGGAGGRFSREQEHEGAGLCNLL